MSTYTEKIDVLELVINCIQEKEQKAADLIQVLENVAYIKNLNR